jgi:histidine kinase
MEPQLSLNESNYYGRKSEKEALDGLFDKSRHESQYVTITGRSGSGKTSLVESRRWEQDKHCYFVTGKFELLQSLQPFSAIASALSDLCSKWSSTEEGKSEIQEFCKKNSRDESVLKMILPNLYRLSSFKRQGENPVTDMMSGEFGVKHSLERLRTVVCKLLRCVATPSKPVMVLLNDLQLADQPSLDLIKFLVDENLKGFFLVATYRSDEVNDEHPVTAHLTSIRQSKGFSEAFDRSYNIHLGGFTLEEVNDLFSTMTKKEKEETLPLVEVVHEKTAGNPFFVDQFLQLLQGEVFLPNL